MKIDFEAWLMNNYIMKNGKKLSESSAKKYLRAINTVSEEMLSYGTINKTIIDMNMEELDINYYNIFNDKNFIKKDSIGNHMYSCALKRYRCYRHFCDNPSLDEQKFGTKRNKHFFMKELLEKYDYECIISHVSIVPVLVGSYIKPWSVSAENEKEDINNCLILCATYGKLLESGLITFNEHGKLILSDIINENEMKKLGIQANTKVDLRMEGNMKEYLRYHNQYVFVD